MVCSNNLKRRLISILLIERGELPDKQGQTENTIVLVRHVHLKRNKCKDNKCMARKN